jgi:hypothetical protein
MNLRSHSLDKLRQIITTGASAAGCWLGSTVDVLDLCFSDS